MPKVIVVAPQDVYTYLHGLYHNPTEDGGWELQQPVETVRDMFNGFEDGSLTNQVEIVIFNDSSLLYEDQEEYELLVQTIAMFAPHATVMTLFYDYANNAARLHEAVSAYTAANGMDEYRFYDIDAQDSDLDSQMARVLGEFANEPRIVPKAAVATPQAPTLPGHAAPQGNLHAEAPQEEEPAAPPRGKILVSTSSKGGSGKTSLALCTATTLYYSSLKAAEAGLREEPLRIVLVDLDTRDGQISLNIGVTVPTALNILVDDSNDSGVISQEVIAKNLVHVQNLGIYTLLAPKRPRTASHLQPSFYQNILEQLTQMFDVVIIDTSVNYLDKLLGEVALPMADSIMFVADFSMGAVFGMTRWIDEVTSPDPVTGNKVDLDKIGVVMNKSARNLGVDQDLLKQAAMGADIVCSIPLDSQAMIAASNYKRLQDIVQRHETISPAYFEIAQYFFPDEELLPPLIEGSQADTGKKPKRQALEQLKEENKPKKRLFGRG